VLAQAATGVTFTLSAGFITWLLRAGSLVTSLLTSMPMWRGFDPLPVLMAGRTDRKRLMSAIRRQEEAEELEQPSVSKVLESQPKKRRRWPWRR
jgi:hypothetical protein